MRFAFKTANQSTTWRDVLAVWKEADQIELFESGWNFDHFYPIDGNSDGPCLEGWMMLAGLAQATNGCGWALSSRGSTIATRPCWPT